MLILKEIAYCFELLYVLFLITVSIPMTKIIIRLVAFAIVFRISVFEFSNVWKYTFTSKP